MGSKEQYMGLVEGSTMRRLDALRIVTSRSRARVSEELLLAALPEREREVADRLERLAELARREGVPVETYVKAYAAENSRKTYGPTLEELEAEAGIVVPS